MNDELGKVFWSINFENLTKTNIKELHKYFDVCNDYNICGCLAIIFSDCGYKKAHGSIYSKIIDKKSFGRNGSMVYALENLVTRKNIFDLVNIILTQKYESRRTAFFILEGLLED